MLDLLLDMVNFVGNCLKDTFYRNTNFNKQVWNVWARSQLILVTWTGSMSSSMFIVWNHRDNNCWLDADSCMACVTCFAYL